MSSGQFGFAELTPVGRLQATTFFYKARKLQLPVSLQVPTNARRFGPGNLNAVQLLVWVRKVIDQIFERFIVVVEHRKSEARRVPALYRNDRDQCHQLIL
jgi:hypothetical protein